MRLATIENPRHIMTRRAYRMMERQFGKVPTPLKVIYARKPRLLPLLMLITRTVDRGISLDPQMRLLLLNFVDKLNGCSFCGDYRLAIAVQKRMGLDKFRALDDFRANDLFTARESAALVYAEETTLQKSVSDETFAELQQHFSDVEIVELTWLIAIENYFNLMKLALRLNSDGLQQLAEDRIGGLDKASAGSV